MKHNIITGLILGLGFILLVSLLIWRFSYTSSYPLVKKPIMDTATPVESSREPVVKFKENNF